MTPTVTATVTEKRTVTIRPTLRRKLLSELKTYAELHAQKAAIEQAMEKHKAAVETFRAETGEANLEVDGFKIAYVEGKRTTLSKERLLLLGVSMDVLEEATVTTVNKPYTRISCPGSKSNGD
jgi:hypothetical protein